MDILAIILFAVLSTSTARVDVDYDDDKYIPASSRQTAIEEFETLEGEANTQYNKLLANFLAYNETAMVLLAKFNKTYYDDLNDFLIKGEDELIVSGVPVFPKCKVIYDKLTGVANKLKENLKDCNSDLLTRNTDYLRNLDERWLAIRRDVDNSKKFQTELAQRRKGGLELQISDADLIDYKKFTAESTREYLKKQIAEGLEKPDWAVDSMVKSEISDCLSKHSFPEFREHLSELAQDIKNCVSSERSTWQRT